MDIECLSHCDSEHSVKSYPENLPLRLGAFDRSSVFLEELFKVRASCIHEAISRVLAPYQFKDVLYMASISLCEGFVLLDINLKASKVLRQLQLDHAPHSLHRVQLTAYGI